jgi:hypothetical protein
MNNNGMFITAAEVAEDFGVSKACGYSIVKKLNDELKEQGYLTICGRVSRQYYIERVHGACLEGAEMDASI